VTVDLFLRPEILAVCQLPTGTRWPSPPAGGSLFSITAAETGLTVVCRPDEIPPEARVEPDWRALSVVGPLDFSLIGVIGSLTTLLAEAGVSVFVLSTFDTDHVLIKEDTVDMAIDALREAGHTVTTD
jgi:uncharacterized protein